MEDTLVAGIQFSLNNYLYDNALFLAERLQARVKNETAIFNLGTVYLQMGKIAKAYEVLRDAQSEENRYLFALVAFKLQKYKEAESSLLDGVSLTTTSQGIPDAVPNGAAGFNLLGLIYKAQNIPTKAKQCFTKSLEMNPFLWTSYEALCSLGEETDPEVFFGADESALEDHMQSIKNTRESAELTLPLPTRKMEVDSSIEHTVTKSLSFKTPSAPAAHKAKRADQISTPAIARRLILTNKFGHVQSPFTKAGDMNTPRTPHDSKPTPSKLSTPGTPGTYITPKVVQGKGNVVAQRKRNQGEADAAVGRLFTPSGSTAKRSSARLFSNQEKETNTHGRTPPIHNNVTTRTTAPVKPTAPKKSLAKGVSIRPKSLRLIESENNTDVNNATPGRKDDVLDHFKEEAMQIDFMADVPAADCGSCSTAISINGTNTNTASSSGSVTIEGTVEVLTLLRTFAEAYRLLSRYECQAAIRAFHRLPQVHFNSPWVMTMVAKAHFELAKYQEAKQLFLEVRRMEPYRTNGMEIFSTILWHLRNEVDLSYLAHELLKYDHEAPESWCAVGNCFALQKEHETALKFFQRALHLNPEFTYAYTLSGHEYVATDNWEKALACFRNALRLDPRHYNAWYGLGIIYYRQEKFAMAEHYFKKALAINKYNSVLYCYIGMALQAQGKPREALREMNTALSIDPRNSLAKFKKASVLTSLGEYPKALEELEMLQDWAPKEAPILYLMGRIYKKLNKLNEAMNCFSMAHDIDSKHPMIKAAIEKLNQKDEPDEPDELI
jgi:anaphase-promoting complex subunit 3